MSSLSQNSRPPICMYKRYEHLYFNGTYYIIIRNTIIFSYLIKEKERLVADSSNVTAAGDKLTE
jgi:hypothetical protein